LSPGQAITFHLLHLPWLLLSRRLDKTKSVSSRSTQLYQCGSTVISIQGIDYSTLQQFIH